MKCLKFILSLGLLENRIWGTPWKVQPWGGESEVKGKHRCGGLPYQTCRSLAELRKDTARPTVPLSPQLREDKDAYTDRAIGGGVFPVWVPPVSCSRFWKVHCYSKLTPLYSWVTSFGFACGHGEGCQIPCGGVLFISLLCTSYISLVA